MDSKVEIKVDQDLCIGCGMCINMCPDVFMYNEESLSTVKSDLAEFNLQSVEEAREICPVDAITVEKLS
ncbi:MAG: ferredoxin [Acutalibacteraceae bacterium]